MRHRHAISDADGTASSPWCPERPGGDPVAQACKEQREIDGHTYLLYESIDFHPRPRQSQH
jgi:hypothetical protein